MWTDGQTDMMKLLRFVILQTCLKTAELLEAFSEMTSGYPLCLEGLYELCGFQWKLLCRGQYLDAIIQ